MVIEGVGLPFQEAIDYFRQKVNLPTDRWDDLRHGAHVRAFSVAGVTRDDILTTFRREIDRALTEGGDLDQFRKVFDAVVDSTGWDFRARGSTDEARRAWRSRVIFQTNMRTAYMAGRFSQLRDPDMLRLRPYWRYRHGDSRRPRPLHLAWDGLVLRADDPWWEVHFPPNGWGCSCDVEAIGPRQLARMGRTGPDAAPQDGTWTGRDPRTGEAETRHLGVDRGWEYNVGQSWVDGLVPRELAAPLEPGPSEPNSGLQPLPIEPVAAPELPGDMTDEEYVAAFLRAFGAEEKPAVWRDRSGGVLTIDRSLFEARDREGRLLGTKANKRGRGAQLLRLADAIQDPDEIWAWWEADENGRLQLGRSYLKRIDVPKEGVMLTVFRWVRNAWQGITTYPARENRGDKNRKGALLYKKKEAGPSGRSLP